MCVRLVRNGYRIGIDFDTREKKIVVKCGHALTDGSVNDIGERWMRLQAG